MCWLTELNGRNLLDGTVEMVVNKKIDAETDSQSDSAQFCFLLGEV